MICKNCGVDDDAVWAQGIITVIEEMPWNEREEFVFCSHKCMIGWFGE